MRSIACERASMKLRERTQAAQGAHQGVRGGKHLREALLPAEGQRADVLARSLRVDRVEVVDRRRAERLEDERQLVVVCTSRGGEHERVRTRGYTRAEANTYSLFQERAAGR